MMRNGPGLDDKFVAIQQFLDEHRREGGLSGDAYLVGLVLLTAARFGPDISGIAAELDLDEAFVQAIDRRMRYSGLWSEGSVSTEGWFYDESFPGFYEDLAVAEGLSVFFQANGEVHYIPARPTSFK